MATDTTSRAPDRPSDSEPSPVRRFDRVLVANRGEIACRVFRTAHRLGMTAIAVYSDADADARHVRDADIALRLGPAPARESYLSIDRVLDAAARSGAEAVHPGYGFLAENAEFARRCAAAGLIWIGPPPEAISSMGDKISAKQLVAAAGVPVVPGRAEAGMSDADLAAAAAEVGWPVLLKPSAGGGGKGMHVVTDPAELSAAIARARREAAASFGDDTLFVERFVANPRHIEVQVIADTHGRVVHLGERECSLQRRHQKVIEEAPSALLDPPTRDRIGRAACDTAASVGYVGAGTVEFIVSDDAPDEFFFMEMNTRLQVEHPVTELVTGLDLVELQLRVAAGERLPFEQDDVRLSGHAVEARVYAEDPDRGFLPTSGTLHALAEPAGDGVRVDSSLLPGAALVTDYDPMLAKVIAHGADREQAILRLDEALAGTVLLGVTSNVGFLRRLLADPDVRAGRLDTGLIERGDFAGGPPPDPAYAVAAVGLAAASEPSGTGPWDRSDGWRLAGVRAPRRWELRAAGRDAVQLSVSGGLDDAVCTVIEGDRSAELPLRLLSRDRDRLEVVVAGERIHARWAAAGSQVWVHVNGFSWSLEQPPPRSLRGGDSTAATGEVRSPMPGTVISVSVAAGEAVDLGQPVAVVEAMKMEHTLAAPVAGTVAELLVRPGDAVALDQLIGRVDPA